MKIAVLSLVFLALWGELPGQSWPELTLEDGRTLKNVKFVSQSPDSVMVRHSEGLAQIKKTSLPAELQKKYPVDTLAARRDTRQQAEAKEELIRQKQMADNRARRDYEARRSVERAAKMELEKETAKVESVRQAARERGELKGDLYLQRGPVRARSVVLNVANIGDSAAIFDWREIEAVTVKGESYAVTSAMPMDAAKQPDFSLAPKQTRSFELVFGGYQIGNTGIALEAVRWKP